MKNKISNKVTFFKIADFYDPQSVIGKGSSARVLLVQKLFDNEKFAVKSIDKAYLFKSDTGLVIIILRVGSFSVRGKNFNTPLPNQHRIIEIIS